MFIGIPEESELYSNISQEQGGHHPIQVVVLQSNEHGSQSCTILVYLVFSSVSIFVVQDIGDFMSVRYCSIPRTSDSSGWYILKMLEYIKAYIL